MDESLIEILGMTHDVPITYAGGIRSFQDIYLLQEMGRSRIDFTVGSALDIFGGDLSYSEIVDNFV